ncbi:hypothetical protein SRABI80_03111 [Peribacillus frigoritolerans]|uniref:hypothetical protein n=1 Tax=Peribacillus frigoritolerans TaxID=450367 RepID=UPI001D9D4E87|nr:hypothetical protein [Peribacillus frigoritolerans]CAH0256449.1 hypothetical protein SRABI80_03111 [Peribacillus frigoritolerans]
MSGFISNKFSEGFSSDFSGQSFSEVINGDLYKEAELFSVGTHRGVEYTEEDLKVLVDTLHPEDDIPVQLDHSESAKDTVGFLQEVSLSGGKLFGKLKIIDKEAQEKAQNGLYKKLSISFYLENFNGKAKPYRIREVSLVAFPQVKSAQMFAEDGSLISNYEDGGNNMKTENKNLERLGFLLNKALNTNEPLSVAEIKELHALWALMEDIEKEKKEKCEQEELGEKIDRAVNKSMIQFALKRQKQISFDKLPASEKFNKLKKELDGLQKSPYVKALLKEKKEQEEKEAFERFYEEHANKHGRSL